MRTISQIYQRRFSQVCLVVGILYYGYNLVRDFNPAPITHLEHVVRLAGASLGLVGFVGAFSAAAITALTKEPPSEDLDHEALNSARQARRGVKWLGIGFPVLAMFLVLEISVRSKPEPGHLTSPILMISTLSWFIYEVIRADQPGVQGQERRTS